MNLYFLLSFYNTLVNNRWTFVIGMFIAFVLLVLSDIPHKKRKK